MSDYTLVLPNIFIGNAAASKDLQFFKTYKVTHVINLTEKESNYFENHDSINNVKYLHIALSDTCSTNISYHFSQTNKFISMCMSDNKHVLLIHCKCGVSRSSTILLAWLVGVKKLTVSNALSQIKCKRRRIRPNVGFFLQLLKLEKQISNATTVGEKLKWKPSLLPHKYCELPEETWLLMMKISSSDELPTEINEKQFKLLRKIAFRGRKKKIKGKTAY